jgi:hypothetical protein
MEIVKFVFNIIAAVGAIVGAFVVYKGLDLRKPRSWLYGAAAFLVGFMAGLLFGNIIEGLKGGAMLAFLILFCGAISRWHRQRYQHRE